MAVPWSFLLTPELPSCWRECWYLGDVEEDLLVTEGWCGYSGLLPCYDNAGVDVALVYRCGEAWFMEDGFVILGMAYWPPNICSSDSWMPKGWREFIARLWRVGWTILAIPGNKEALMSSVFYDAVPAVPFAIRLNRSLVFYDFLFPLYLT